MLKINSTLTDCSKTLQKPRPNRRIQQILLLFTIIFLKIPRRDTRVSTEIPPWHVHHDPTPPHQPHNDDTHHFTNLQDQNRPPVTLFTPHTQNEMHIIHHKEKNSKKSMTQHLKVKIQLFDSERRRLWLWHVIFDSLWYTLFSYTLPPHLAFDYVLHMLPSVMSKRLVSVACSSLTYTMASARAFPHTLYDHHRATRHTISAHLHIHVQETQERT